MSWFFFDREATAADEIVAVTMQFPVDAFAVLDRISFHPNDLAEPHFFIMSAIFDLHLAGSPSDCLSIVRELERRGEKLADPMILYWLDGLFVFRTPEMIERYAYRARRDRRFAGLAIRAITAIRDRKPELLESLLSELEPTK